MADENPLKNTFSSKSRLESAKESFEALLMRGTEGHNILRSSYQSPYSSRNDSDAYYASLGNEGCVVYRRTQNICINS